MEKKIFIPFICLLIITINGCAPVKKIYAYRQASIPGILPASETERKQNYNYWFYLSVPKKETITITGLWISGKQYDIKSELITGLPVRKIVFTGLEKNDTMILVPVTNNKIILVYPSGERPDDVKHALSLVRTNELVIRYVSKSKTYYATIKKMKELNPDVRP